MTQKSYRIKPLEWTNESTNSIELFVMRTPFCNYDVWRTSGDWGWCFDDSASQPCDSLAHGQQLAQSHYERRLLAALEPVEEK